MSEARPPKLLTDLLAVQLGIPPTPQLRAAVGHWLDQPHVPLPELLVQRDVIDDTSRRVLQRFLQDSEATLLPSPTADTEDDPHSTQYVHDEATGPNERPAPSTQSRFRKLRDHARGGLGQVFVAVDGELNRQVALKQMQDRFAEDPSARQRFLLEAEITGGLEHPGVVPVYGLGLDPDGQPYYAMRFIRGQSFHAAVKRFHESSPPARGSSPERWFELRKLLGRMIDVCQAIAYAHSRGVLHRDIKPDNIMLGKFGETLVVDWGLAKVADGDESGPHQAGSAEGAQSGNDEPRLNPLSGNDSAPTRIGSVLGTPAFMSPEQAAGELQHVDARSDVYSLGATLYYLLAGQPAFPSHDESGRPLAMDELLQRVRQGRFTPLRERDPSLPKGLVAICHRAMATKPEHRYANAQDLAEELERWLADEPVQAYPESWLQRSRRWLKRHPTLTASVASMTVLGLLGMSVFTVVLRGKNQELDRRGTLLAQSNEQLRLAEAEAQEKAAVALAVTEFLNDDLLAQASPEDHPNPHLEVRTVFQQAADSLEGRFAQQPLVKASLLDTIGVAMGYLGQLEESEAALTEAHRLRSSLLGEHATETLRTQSRLAQLMATRGRYEPARQLLEQTLRKQKQQIGAPHPDVAESLAALGNLYLTTGQYEPASAVVDQLIVMLEQLHSEQHPDLLEGLSLKVRLLNEQGKMAEALRLAREVAQRAEAALGSEHMVTLYAQTALAQRLFNEERYEQARPLYQQVLESLKNNLGERHPYVLAVRSDLAMMQAFQEDPQAALVTLRQIADAEAEVLGPTNRETIVSQLNVGKVLALLNRHDEAVDVYEESIAVAANSLGDDSAVTQQLRVLLAQSLYQQDDRAAAEAALQKVLQSEAGTNAMAAADPGRADAGLLIPEAQATLAAIHRDSGRLTSAIELLRNASQRYEAAGLASTQTAMATEGALIAALVEAGDRDEAVQWVAAKAAASQADSVSLMSARVYLVEALLTVGESKLAAPLVEQLDRWLAAQQTPNESALLLMHQASEPLRLLGRYDDAVDVLQRAVDGITERLGGMHAQTLLVMNDLGYTLALAERYQQAEHLLAEVVLRRGQVFGADDPFTMRSLENLAQVQVERGNTDGAIESLNQLYRRYQDLPDDDPEKLEVQMLLAELNRTAGNHSRAAALYESVVAVRRVSLGAHHADTLYALHQWAYCCDLAGKPEKAIELYEQVVAGRTETLGPAHQYTLLSLSNWAYLQALQGDHRAAAERFEEWLQRVVQARGAEHYESMEPRHQLAGMEYLLGNYAKAADLVQHNVRLSRPTISESSSESSSETAQREFAQMLIVLADSYSHAGDPAEARSSAAEGLRRMQQLDPDSPWCFRAQSVLGAAQAAAEEYAAAELSLQQAYEGLTDRAEDMDAERRQRLRVDTVRRLIELFTQTGNRAARQAWQRTLEDLQP